MLSGRLKWLGLAVLVFLSSLSLAQNVNGTLVDKTLLAWVAPATLEQGGGSVLTIDNGDGSFDGIVFGELEAKRWMPGSNGYSRTEKDQKLWPAEGASGKQFVQLAIVYRGREIAMYRNGKPYAHYTMTQDPQRFGLHSVVLFGRRHLDAADPERTFLGRIKDARIYDRALDQHTIASLKPGQAMSRTCALGVVVVCR